MSYDGKAAIFAQREPEPVFDFLAAIEHPVRLHFFEQRTLAQLVFVEVAVPEQKVVDAAQQAAVADFVKVRGPADMKSASLAGFVSRDSPGHDQRAIVVKPSVTHAERLENIFFGELRERLASGAADNDAHQKVVRIAVEILVAGIEVETFLVTDEIEKFVRRVNVLGVAASQEKKAENVAQTAGVVQHLPKRDGLAIGGQFRDIFVHIIIEGEETLLGGKHDAGGGELLGHRAHVENGLRGNRNAKFETCTSVAPLVGEVAIAHDTEGAAGRAGLVIGCEHLIDFLFEAVRPQSSKAHRGEQGTRKQRRNRGHRTQGHSVISKILAERANEAISTARTKQGARRAV